MCDRLTMAYRLMPADSGGIFRTLRRLYTPYTLMLRSKRIFVRLLAFRNIVKDLWRAFENQKSRTRAMKAVVSKSNPGLRLVIFARDVS
jgi:hypothetical protein